MKKPEFANTVLFALVSSVLLLVQAPDLRAATIYISATSSYLRYSGVGEPPSSAVPIDLVSLGFQAGDWIRLDQLGDISPRPGYGDGQRSMSGVFSSSTRVTDAVYAGNVTSIVTGSDIPQDFVIFSYGLGVYGIDVQIPSAARYLFVAPINQTPGDASDPDSDYALQIGPGVVTVPDGGQTAPLLTAAMLGAIAYGWRTRKTSLQNQTHRSKISYSGKPSM